MRFLKNIVILTLLFLLSCKKDRAKINTNNSITQTTTSNNGELTVLINGIKWSCVVYTKNQTRFSFTAIKYKIVGGVSVPFESLTFNLLQKTLLKQRLYAVDSLLNTNPTIAKTSTSFHTSQDDGDVSCDDFELITADSLNNYIQITNANGDYSDISGIFNSSYKKISTCNSSNYPDTINLKNGTFHIYLKQ